MPSALTPESSRERAPLGPGDRGAELEPIDAEHVLSPFKASEWLALTPAERLERAWALRSMLVDPQAAHDAKLFPAP